MGKFWSKKSPVTRDGIHERPLRGVPVSTRPHARTLSLWWWVRGLGPRCPPALIMSDLYGTFFRLTILILIFEHTVLLGATMLSRGPYAVSIGVRANDKLPLLLAEHSSVVAQHLIPASITKDTTEQSFLALHLVCCRPRHLLCARGGGLLSMVHVRRVSSDECRHVVCPTHLHALHSTRESAMYRSPSLPGKRDPIVFDH